MRWAGESGGRGKAGQVRYWQYGQAEKSPDLAISDPSRFRPQVAYVQRPAKRLPHRRGVGPRNGRRLCPVSPNTVEVSAGTQQSPTIE